MLRSKRSVNVILVIVGLCVSSILSQCAVRSAAVPAQGVDISENTVALAQTLQTDVTTTFGPSATSTPATATMTPTVSSTPDAPILPPGGPGAATNLQSEVECEEPGKPIAKLSWLPAANPGRAQRVDVTIYSFEEDKFESSELLPPDQDSLVWEQLKGQAIHNWRVLTLQADGWVPSETASFEGPTCVGEEEESIPTTPIIR